MLKAILYTLLTAAVLVAVAIMVMRTLFGMPSLADRQASQAIPLDEATPLGGGISQLTAGHPGLSGILPLGLGADAYAARVVLAAAATRSIDAQYYIWHHDPTGIALLDELRLAAERGVRVRLLVDDNGTRGLDRELAEFNRLPNAEVRIFNPFNLRKMALLSYTFDFFRLNHRMHNKSFTVDGAITIIGGRNIGDIYFARATESQYSDFDLAAVGDVVKDVATDFDRYWNSMSAYPHELVVTPPPEGSTFLPDRRKELDDDPVNIEYGIALRNTQLIKSLIAGTLTLDWARTVLVSDPPSKGLGEAPQSEFLVGKLSRILGATEHEVDIISAYFVPGKTGVQMLGDTVARGVTARTMTNSLEATDVLAVHASYTKYREDLIDRGVEVYELKSNPGAGEVADRLGIMGSSAASLHAKTFSIDDDRVFVGSFNFDPRSVFLNCEMGFLVYSRSLSAYMKSRFDVDLAAAAWRVTKTDGELVWTSTAEDGTTIVQTTEPGTTFVKRVALAVIGALPIEWMM